MKQTILNRTILLITLCHIVSIEAQTTIANTNTIPSTTINLVGAGDFISEIVLENAMLAYKLEVPEVSFTYNIGTTEANKNSIFKTTADFGIIAKSFTDVEKTVRSTSVMYPFLASAIVPIYRLDALDSSLPSIVLDRETLGKIFFGNITNWNHAAIKSLNPYLPLPNKIITGNPRKKISNSHL
jgi:ABC-type phosphate transport system substrate-binding protein